MTNRRQLAEDAAEEYSGHNLSRCEFVRGWLDFCYGKMIPGKQFICCRDGYIAARDAAE